ncbi:MAG: 30S ribosomal protein S17 [Pseudomonadota bacterium]
MTSETTQTKSRQEIRGVVVSDKMNKTRVIEIKRTLRHSLYHKNVLRSSKIFIHDEKNESKVGDVVTAVATRPLSRHKQFTLLNVVEKRVEQ